MTKYQFNSIYKNDETESTGLLFIKVYNKWESNLKKSLEISWSHFASIYRFNLALVFV